MATPEFPVFVSYPFRETKIDHPKEFPQFRFPELRIVIEPVPSWIWGICFFYC